MGAVAFVMQVAKMNKAMLRLASAQTQPMDFNPLRLQPSCVGGDGARRCQYCR